MLRSFIIIILLSGNFFITNAQEKLDSIFTKNEILTVNIKEVTEEVIKYSYPGEEITNSLKLASVSEAKKSANSRSCFFMKE